MRLRVLGCHGGTSRRHRSVSFLVDEHLALDAGSIATALELEEQARVTAVLVTHPHIDHIADLGTLCDSRAHLELEPLVVAGLAPTLDALRTHFFNGVLWPDFTRIRGPRDRVVDLLQLGPEALLELGDHTVRAVPVDHSVPSCGFVVGNGESTLAYSGDTGPTRRFWDVLGELPRLDGVITEVSFPDRLGELAERSGHLTPRTLAAELPKLKGHDDAPVWLYGLKPPFEEEILEQLAGVVGERVRVLEADEVVEV